ncbi:Oligosaccaryltransferase-domain-containing protein [Apiospora arundinis]|uniref:Dolichyl-diphosphooligosaccharide--protein glycosyltransferase subunit 4 n=1 Tax=Apiospora arundinis TaxID=335852 RepID=A0ABR2IFZ5_9PEZI
MLQRWPLTEQQLDLQPKPTQANHSQVKAREIQLPYRYRLQQTEQIIATMISDDDLYRLAIFLGSVSMVLIVVYHFFEVNSVEEGGLAEKAAKARPAQQPAAVGKQTPTTK